MTAKMTIDDLFEKDEQVDAARLVRLQRWEGWLRVALGVAIACLLFTPNLLNDSAKHFILTFTLWLVPFGFSLFLLFWPSWRSIPISSRRPCIILSLAVSLVAFSVLPTAALVSDGAGSVLVLFGLFGLLALAAFALVRLNIRWQATDKNGELFA